MDGVDDWGLVGQLLCKTTGTLQPLSELPYCLYNGISWKLKSQIDSSGEATCDLEHGSNIN